MKDSESDILNASILLVDDQEKLPNQDLNMLVHLQSK